MNEVKKNITDHYGNSQMYNAYKIILDKILNITLFETDFHDTHSMPMGIQFNSIQFYLGIRSDIHVNTTAHIIQSIS